MKTILVLTGGSHPDHVVFETALAVARPLGAHIDFGGRGAGTPPIGRCLERQRPWLFRERS